MFFIPYEVDVPSDRRAITNWIIVSLIVVIFMLQRYSIQQYQEKAENHLGTNQNIEWTYPFEPFVLYGWTIKGLFGHMWLHGGWSHMIGNLIFLWLFGNAVCTKIGNGSYLIVYVFLGLAAAAFHQTFNGGPAIGASGAINAIVGMYLVFFPENAVNCLILSFRPDKTSFSISGIWIILLWFIYDIWGLIDGTGHVAYWAHVGGFISGFGLAVLMLIFKTVEVERYEKTLLQMAGIHKKIKFYEDSDIRRDFAYWQQNAIEENLKPREKENPEVPQKQVEQTEKKDFIPADFLIDPNKDLGPIPFDTVLPAKKETEFVEMKCVCGKHFSVPLAFSGRTAICPSCNSEISLPEENFIRTACICGKSFKIPRVLAGKSGNCPKCGRKILITEKNDSQEMINESSFEKEFDKIAEIILDTEQINESKNVEEVFISKHERSAGEPENLKAIFHCSCGYSFTVPIEVSHRQLNCPKCRNPVKLSDENFIRMFCSCGMDFKVPVILEGKFGICPGCKKRMKISKTPD